MNTQTRLAISLSNDPMNTEYVTLAEVQKEIEKLEIRLKYAVKRSLLNKNACRASRKHEAELEKQIKDANKILAEIPLPYFISAEVRKGFQRLRETLNSQFKSDTKFTEDSKLYLKKLQGEKQQ